MNNVIVRDLVLVGGGHTHVIVLRRFGMNPLPGLRITVVARDIDTPYSGMLPGFVAGHYSFDDVHIDLGPLCRFAGARLIHDSAVGLDLERRRVHCANRPDVPFDVLSINTGSAPAMAGTPGAAENATPVKPIGGFVARWEQLVAAVRSSASVQRVAVVGAGAGGIELVLAMHHALSRDSGHPTPEFTVFSGADVILPAHPESVRRRFDKLLEKRGIVVERNARVVDVQADAVITADAERHETDHVLWVTNAGAPPWLAETGLAVDERGFLTVHDSLESTSHPGIFAAGDVAHVLNHPREKAGVFAVRQGPPLEANLRRAARGEGLRPFRPQTKFLSLISTGNRSAVGSRGGSFSVAGRWVWYWKDRIDRKFMRRFSELPEMTHDERPPRGGLVDASTLDAIAMTCAGCGAKVGSTVLTRVLATLSIHRRDDVLVGLESPDDAAVLDVPDGHVVVQTVDALRSLVDDPYDFARITTEHALGDIYAMGAAPQAALAIITVPFGIESKTEALLEQIMSGITEVLGEARATLVGGHTSEGAELMIGLSLTGHARRDELLRKSGMQPGQTLILTKPLGVGTLFAADMRARAKGRWIDAAITSMLRSQRAAPGVLAEHGVTACTDVTGFGLAGHLLEMLRASGDVAAQIDLDTLPVLDGALSTISAGLHSSLYPDNLSARPALGIEIPENDPRIPLLFDPQTAGGLLASVPESEASACIAELRAGGLVDATVIGCVVARAPGEPRLQLRDGGTTSAS